MVEISFVDQRHEIIGIFHGGRLDGHPGSDFIAEVARTCYRSEGTDNDRLVGTLIERGHEAMVEHSFLSVRFVTDRAIANEIVRHRHFSFAQESTRYVNYGRKGCRFVLPEGLSGTQDAIARIACHNAARDYEALLRLGAPPEIARGVLPLCTATTIVVSGNFREWRHFLKLRCDRHAHPQMRSLVTPLLGELKHVVPIVFDDIEAE